MSGFDIRLRDRQVAPDHVERGVAEDPLQRVDVPVISQKLNGEGVPEAMRVHPLHAGAGADPAQDMMELARIERGPGPPGGEEGSVHGFIPTGGQVAPDDLAGDGVKGDQALFVAFAHDDEVVRFEVHVADGQAAELAGAEAAVQEEIDDGAIARGGGVAVPARALARALIGSGFVHGVQERFDLELAEGLNHTLFRDGRGNVADDVARGQALVHRPAPQGRETGVMAE